jgi:uncharacterized protein YraI
VSFKLPPNATGIEVVSGGCDAGWCRIRYKCTEGWASERFLSLSSGDAPTSVAAFQAKGEFKVNVRAGEGPLYVREDPHPSAPIVAELSPTDPKVLVRQCITPKRSTETWCFLTSRNREGWSNARYLIDESTGRTPTGR